MSSARSVTSAAHRIPSHAGPSPRAAGAPFHVGRGSPGQAALPSPGRISGSYSSFQPPGGLAPGVHRHHGAAVPSAPPHDRQVPYVRPGNRTRSRSLETPAAQPLAGNPTPGIPAAGALNKRAGDNAGLSARAPVAGGRWPAPSSMSRRSSLALNR